MAPDLIFVHYFECDFARVVEEPAIFPVVKDESPDDFHVFVAVGALEFGRVVVGGDQEAVELMATARHGSLGGSFQARFFGLDSCAEDTLEDVSFSHDVAKIAKNGEGWCRFA